MQPIELSPIPQEYQSPWAILGPFQYEHALRYQNSVRPALSVLRVSKRFHALGSRIYYRKNAFAFSSPVGWLVIARFFKLIGSVNTSMLRNITIIHPTLSQAPSITTDKRIEGFYIDQLSPFGLADLPGYDETYFVTGEESGLKAVNDPLEALRQISDLRNLTLLYYGDGSRAPFASPHSNGDVDHRIQQDAINTLPHARQDRLSISVIHLFSTDQDYDPDYLGLTLAAVHNGKRHRLSGTPGFAVVQSAGGHFESLGWAMKDERVCRHRAAWPIAWYESTPSEAPHGDATQIEWSQRKMFEAHYMPRRGNDPIDSWGICGDNMSNTCVECWLPIGPSNFPSRSCHCPGGPTKLSKNWKPCGLLLGNPGVPIRVDVGTSDGENVSWKKSHVVQYIEKGRKEGWKKFFGFGKHDLRLQDWAENEATKDHMIEEVDVDQPVSVAGWGEASEM